MAVQVWQHLAQVCPSGLDLRPIPVMASDLDLVMAGWLQTFELQPQQRPGGSGRAGGPHAPGPTPGAALFSLLRFPSALAARCSRHSAAWCPVKP